MRLLKKMRKQDAVYWPRRTEDQYSEKAYELPIDLKVRWEDEYVQSFDEEGRETIFTSTVFVDRDMEVGDRIMLGTAIDLTGPLPPPSEAKEVRKFERVPTLNAKDFLRVVYL